MFLPEHWVLSLGDLPLFFVQFRLSFLVLVLVYFGALHSIHESHLIEERWSLILLVDMSSYSHPLFSEFSKLEIHDHFDDDVRSYIMEMDDSRSVLENLNC